MNSPRNAVPTVARLELDRNERETVLMVEEYFESAAKAWERGNNSGDSRRLEYGEQECDRLRRLAERTLAVRWPEIKVRYPGLYPYFEGVGWSAMYLEDAVRRVIEIRRPAAPATATCPHCGRTDRHLHEFGGRDPR